VKAILDIRGWRKEANIESLACDKGYVDIGLSPPLSILIKPGDTDGMAEKVRLVYWGLSKSSGLPIFGYEE